MPKYIERYEKMRKMLLILNLWHDMMAWCTSICPALWWYGLWTLFLSHPRWWLNSMHPPLKHRGRSWASGLWGGGCRGGRSSKMFYVKIKGIQKSKRGFYIKHKLFLIFFDDLEFREFLRIWADPRTSCQWISNDAFHLCYPGKVLHDWKRGISHSCHFGYKMAHAHELNRLSVAFLSDKSYPKCAQQYNWWWQ